MIGGGLIGGETRVPSPECLHDWGGLQGTAGDSRGRTWQQIARWVEPDPRKWWPSPVRKALERVRLPPPPPFDPGAPRVRSSPDRSSSWVPTRAPPTQRQAAAGPCI